MADDVHTELQSKIIKVLCRRSSLYLYESLCASKLIHRGAVDKRVVLAISIRESSDDMIHLIYKFDKGDIQMFPIVKNSCVSLLKVTQHTYKTFIIVDSLLQMYHFCNICGYLHKCHDKWES